MANKGKRKNKNHNRSNNKQQQSATKSESMNEQEEEEQQQQNNNRQQEQEVKPKGEESKEQQRVQNVVVEEFKVQVNLEGEEKRQSQKEEHISFNEQSVKESLQLNDPPPIILNFPNQSVIAIVVPEDEQYIKQANIQQEQQTANSQVKPFGQPQSQKQIKGSTKQSQAIQDNEQKAREGDKITKEQQQVQKVQERKQNAVQLIEADTPGACEEQGPAQVDQVEETEKIERKQGQVKGDSAAEVDNAEPLVEQQLSNPIQEVMTQQPDCNDIEKQEQKKAMDQTFPINQKFMIKQQQQPSNPPDIQVYKPMSQTVQVEQMKQKQSVNSMNNQQWLRSSNQLSYPIMSTPQSDSILITSTVTPVEIIVQKIVQQKQQQREQKVVELVENDDDKLKQKVGQGNQQVKQQISEISELPQATQFIRSNQRNESFIDMLRQSRLQAQEQKVISRAVINHQPSSNRQITYSSISHELIDVSTLQTPSHNPSIVQFIVMNNSLNEQQNSQLQSQQQPRHLIRDQTQQRLASQQQLNNNEYQETQQLVNKNQQSGQKRISVQGIQNQLQRIKNDIEMAQILSSYERGSGMERASIIQKDNKVQKQEEIIERQTEIINKQEVKIVKQNEIKVNQEVKIVEQKEIVVEQEEMVENQSIKQGVLNQLYEKENQFKKQQLQTPKQQQPEQQEQPGNHKQQQQLVKLLIEEQKTIQQPKSVSNQYEIINIQQPKSPHQKPQIQEQPNPQSNHQTFPSDKLLSSPIQLPSPISRSPNHFQEQPAIQPTNNKVQQIKMFFERNSKIVEEVDLEEELGSSSGREVVDSQDDREDAVVEVVVERRISGRSCKQQIKRQQGSIPSIQPFSVQPSQPASINNQLPSYNQSKQKPPTQTPQKSQPDFSEYQMNQQSSIKSVQQSPAKQVELIRQGQDTLHVSRELDQYGEQQYNLQKKEQESPVLYRVRANQARFKEEDVQGEDQIVDNTQKIQQFKLNLQNVSSLDHYQVHSRRIAEVDDLHDPPSSPVDIHTHQTNQPITIHHLGGNYQSTTHHVTFNLNHHHPQQIIHPQPRIIHHLHGHTPQNQQIILQPILIKQIPQQSYHMTQSKQVSIRESQMSSESQILNKLQQVMSEHMITDESIPLNEQNINKIQESNNQHNYGHQINYSEVTILHPQTDTLQTPNHHQAHIQVNIQNQQLIHKQNRNDTMRDFRDRQNEFLKKIIPQPLYIQHTHFNNQQTNRHDRDSLESPDTPMFMPNTHFFEELNQDIAIQQPPIEATHKMTPQRGTQQPSYRVVHSVVRQWNPNSNFISINGLTNNNRSQEQRQFESPDRKSNQYMQRVESFGDQQSSANNEQQWKASHRDTIIDALNDLDESPKHIEYPENQPNPFILPSQPSEFNPTILESFAPQAAEQTTPLIRTQTADPLMDNGMTGNRKETTASMPFLNNRPSDRYRQFIDDDSAQKKVEESRNLGGFIINVQPNKNQEQHNITQTNSNDIKPKPITIQTISISNNQQATFASTTTKPSAQPVVFTMQEYKKRYSAYSFAKPKTNIISLDSIQKQTVNGNGKTQDGGSGVKQVVRVEVVRKIDVVNEISKEKIDHNGEKDLEKERGANEQVKKNGLQLHTIGSIQPIKPSNTHISLQQNSQTSISPPTVPHYVSSSYQPTIYRTVATTDYKPTINTSQHHSTIPSTNQPTKYSEFNNTHSLEPAPNIIQMNSITLAESGYIQLGPYQKFRQKQSEVKDQAKIQMIGDEQIEGRVEAKSGLDDRRFELRQADVGQQKNLKAQQHITVDNLDTNAKLKQQNSNHDNTITDRTEQIQYEQQTNNTHHVVKVPSPIKQTPTTPIDHHITHPASTHQQFFTSYSQTIPQSQSYHTSDNLIYTSHIAQQTTTNSNSINIYPHSSPLVTVPHQPIRQHLAQQPLINQRNIITEKFTRSRERSREKTKVILKFPLHSPTPTNKSFRNNADSVKKEHENARNDERVQNNNNNNISVYGYEANLKKDQIRPFTSYYTTYNRQVFDKYANYDSHNSRQLQNITTPKTYLKQKPYHNTSSPSHSYQHQPHHAASPSKSHQQIYQTGPKGNTNSGSKPKPSQQPISPSYLNQTHTPLYNHTSKFSQPIYSQHSQTMHPIGYQQKLSESLQREFMRVNDSREQKRANSRGKKQKICLTLRRDYIKRPNHQQDKSEQEELSRARPKLKQVKLAKQNGNEQFSPHVIRKEYKEKKFMKIQKFYANQLQAERSLTNQRKEKNLGGKIDTVNAFKDIQQPNRTLGFTKLFSFLDKPQQDQKPQPTDKFTFINQQKSEQLPSKRKYIDTVNHQKPEGSPKTLTTKLLSIGKKPQHVLKTEHYNRKDPMKSEYEKADRTGYKILGEDVGGKDEFKGFVRSKLVREKKFINREIERNPQRNDSLSDVENQDIPMMSH